MKRKKEFTFDEIFCGMPYLKDYFKWAEVRIRNYAKEDKKEELVKRWQERSARLLKTMKNMRIQDLEVIYYIHNIQKLEPYRVLYLLRNLNKASEELNELKDLYNK